MSDVQVRADFGNARGLYTDLLVRSITNTIYADAPLSMDGSPFNPANRQEGKDWPAVAHTMVGVERMKNLADMVNLVIQEGIPGDLIETGVWRGGCCILMRGILAAHGITDRTVYVADSFDGLPPPNPDQYPADAGLNFHLCRALAISEDEVRRNFGRYGLLDDKVRFVKGFFQDTLSTLPAEQLALMRLDGDMYESTIVALEALYPKLSPNGIVIIDDYGAISACAQAVNDFREKHHIENTMHTIDWTGVYWRKSA